MTAVGALGCLDPVTERNQPPRCSQHNMRTSRLAALTLVVASLWRLGGGEPRIHESAVTRVNATAASVALDGLSSNVTETAVESRVPTFTTHLPTLKNVVIAICVLTAVLITILVVKVVRSGRRIRKTRKYDIITTPAERVEMAPLNEENDEDDDSTLFDVKYR